MFAHSLLYLAQGWCWWVSRTCRAVALVVLVACVLAAFALCWWCWQVGRTRRQWHMWWCVCWQHSHCAGSVGRLVVLVGGGACGGMCWRHLCCAGRLVILVGNGNGAGVCAGGVGRSVVLVGGGACAGMCAGRLVILVSGGSGAGVCAGSVHADAGGVGVGLDACILWTVYKRVMSRNSMLSRWGWCWFVVVDTCSWCFHHTCWCWHLCWWRSHWWGCCGSPTVQH